ncbi:MAG: hypothetical protein JXB34_02030 [Bacteroidales bacterium]|nr:hypothetical protein [Bacteroidales bacterium]
MLTKILNYRNKFNIKEWHTIYWFREEFAKHFRIELEEKLEENRILFVGKILV